MSSLQHDEMISDPQHRLPPTPPSELSTDSSKLASDAVSIVGAATETSHKHIWVITGPAGCGKTSVAEFLQSAYDIPYLEGDNFHTPENVQKMAAGRPLTDADRWDWLILLREQALQTLAKASSVIITCSALKRKYRDIVRIAAYHHPDVRIHFIFLCASEVLLMDRVRARQNHYMKDSMVRSQFESLETPQKDEVDILSVDASGNSREVQMLALSVMDKVLVSDSRHD